MKSNQDTSHSPELHAGPLDQDPEVLQTVLGQLYNAVVVTEARLDPPGPRIVYADPAFARRTGNDQYGHAVDDEVLKAIGQEIRRVLRETALTTQRPATSP